MLPAPNYIFRNQPLNSKLNFNWSTDIALKLYAQSDLNHHIYQAANESCYKAKLGLAACICEWSLYRLEGFIDLTDAWSRVAAAWAMVVDLHYVTGKDFDFDMSDDTDSKGDPRGPLEVTLAHLRAAINRYKAGDIWLAEAVTKQAVLARHICPNQPAFDAWLSDTFKATATAFPRSVEYDKESEYYDASAETPVPRAFFDPLADPATDHPAALNAFLKSLDPSTNPYLATPEEMLAAGFTGTPYQYP
jgi:hypothetical protein